MELDDAVILRITCDNCGRNQHGYGADSDYFVEEARQDGWRVTRSDNVLCPECKRVSKKRSK